MNVSTKVTKNIDVSRAVNQGVKEGLEDAADVGFEASQRDVPHGADSFLANSGFVPEWRDNELVWGYTADYAKFVEEGTAPHFPPIEPLKKWARRVLGDEGAAYAVQKKIGEKGTEPKKFVHEGAQAQRRYATKLGLDTYIQREIR